MHVKDERAFQFSDSVLLALESCDQFAIELHPDSIFNALVEEDFFNSIDTPDKLLTHEEMKILKKKFKSETGMDYDNFNFRNPLALREFLSAENHERPQRETFVDAYLLGIAKTMQKSINGLERMESQLSTFSALDSSEQREDLIELIRQENDKKEDFLDKFIEIYSKGNLEDLETYVFPSLSSDSFIERNKTMAESIDKLHKKGTIFSAVGAAHLIGENSVLNLLIERGFEVRRVKAHFTGIAENYKIDHSKMIWQKFVDGKRGFSIETPGVLVQVPGEKFEFINMYSMLDLTGASSYIIFSIDLRSFPKDLKEKDFKKLLLDQFKKDETFKTTKSNKLMRNGIEFNELFFEKDDGSATRLQYCLKNKHLFANACFGYFSQPYPQDQNRFFDSFKVFPPEKKILKRIEWKNTPGAFSINFPEEPDYKLNEVQNPIDLNGDKFLVHMYNSSIPENNSVGFVTYNDFPAGYYRDPFADILDETLNELSQQGTLVSDVDTTYFDNQIAYEFNFLVQDKYPSRMKLLFRGNRSYKIFEMGLYEDIDYSTFKPFLDSFKLLPFESPETKRFQAEDESFEITFLDSKVTKSDSIFGYDYIFYRSDFWSCTNPKSGGFYHLERNHMPKYSKSKNADSLLYNYAHDLLSWSDSVTYHEFISIDSLPALQFKYLNTYSEKLDEVVVWYDGQHVYCFYRITSDEEMQNNDLIDMAKTFKRKQKVEEMNLSSSKANLIVNDLVSDDHARTQALGAFNYYEWEEDERDILEKALYTEFENDSTELEVRKNLISALMELNDSTSRSFIYEYYLHQTEDLKEYILAILSYDGKSDIDQNLIHLFLNETPKKSDAAYVDFFYAIRDSLEVPKENLNAFIEVLEKGYFEKEILHVISKVLIEFPETEAIVKKNMHILTKNAIRDFNAYTEMIENEEVPSYRLIQNYLDLSKSIKHPTFVEPYTRLLGTLEYSWIKNEAIEARVINDIKVKKSKIKDNLKNKYTRYNLMRAFEKGGRFDELPDKYKSEEGMARATLLEYMSWEEYVPDESNVLGIYTQSDSTYYCFELKYDYARHTYLGVVGPFIQKQKPTQLKELKAIVDWEKIQDDWKTQSKVLLPQLNQLNLIKY